MSVYEKLTKIQNILKAPKNQYNNFGKYSYRSCEDILEALKPILLDEKCTLTLDNEIVLIGDKLFRKSTANLYDYESSESLTSTTYTQECLNAPGMSAAQTSGSTASYSDKYCLGKMFLIDDTKDPDTNESYEKNTKPNDKQVNGDVEPSDKQKKFYFNLLNKEYGKNIPQNILDEAKKMDTVQMGQAIDKLKKSLGMVWLWKRNMNLQERLSSI